MQRLVIAPLMFRCTPVEEAPVVPRLRRLLSWKLSINAKHMENHSELGKKKRVKTLYLDTFPTLSGRRGKPDANLHEIAEDIQRSL